MSRSVVLVVLVVLLAGVAHADPDSPAIRSRAVTAVTAPDRIAVTVTGGWNGANARAIGDVSVEAAVVDRLSVSAGGSLGPLRTRPSAGLAYQLLDPRLSPLGLRLTIAYRPEGFTEPEGEIESSAVISRLFGGGVGSVTMTYGQDPGASERDGELALSWLANANRWLAIGPVVRGRSSLGSVRAGEPTWDALAGALGTVVHGRYRAELFAGGSRSLVAGRTDTGVLGFAAVGADL